MRFRKRIKVFPGFYLNISKSGITSSIGGNGASVTIGKNGTYLNTSIPGTGIYNRQKIGGNNSENIDNSKTSNIESFIEKDEIKSDDANVMTSSNLVELKDTILEAYKEKNQVTDEILKTYTDLEKAKKTFKIACFFLIGFIFSSFKKKVIELEEYQIDLANQSKNCKVNIDILIDKSNLDLYNKLKDSFIKIKDSEFIWDITSSSKIDKSKERSSASAKIRREKVKLELKNLDVITSSLEGMFWQNINGDGDIYIYPSFLIYMDVVNDAIGLIDIKDLNLTYTKAETTEPEVNPTDSILKENTWFKVNNDGSPDKRHKGNYEIPVYEYGKIDLKTQLGLNESYLFSNAESSKAFCKIFDEYKANF